MHYSQASQNVIPDQMIARRNPHFKACPALEKNSGDQTGKVNSKIPKKTKPSVDPNNCHAKAECSQPQNI